MSGTDVEGGRKDRPLPFMAEEEEKDGEGRMEGEGEEEKDGEGRTVELMKEEGKDEEGLGKEGEEGEGKGGGGCLLSTVATLDIVVVLLF